MALSFSVSLGQQPVLLNVGATRKCNVQSCKTLNEVENDKVNEKAKKARVVSKAGAGSKKEKESKTNEENIFTVEFSQFSPGSPGDSTLAERASSAPVPSSSAPPSSSEVEVVPDSMVIEVDDGQQVNISLPVAEPMPPPAILSRSYSQSSARSVSPCVRSSRGRSPSVGRRPAACPEEGLLQTTRKNHLPAPIPRAESDNSAPPKFLSHPLL